MKQTRCIYLYLKTLILFEIEIQISYFITQFLVSMGYSLGAIPPNYLDKPPSDVTLAQRNLDLLITMMKGPRDAESYALWNRLEDFLDKTTRDVYVSLDRLLVSSEFVLNTCFDIPGWKLHLVDDCSRIIYNSFLRFVRDAFRRTKEGAGG